MGAINEATQTTYGKQLADVVGGLATWKLPAIATLTGAAFSLFRPTGMVLASAGATVIVVIVGAAVGAWIAVEEGRFSFKIMGFKAFAKLLLYGASAILLHFVVIQFGVAVRWPAADLATKAEGVLVAALATLSVFDAHGTVKNIAERSPAVRAILPLFSQIKAGLKKASPIDKEDKHD